MSRNKHTVIEGNSKALAWCGTFWKSSKVQLTGSHFCFVCDKKGSYSYPCSPLSWENLKCGSTLLVSLPAIGGLLSCLFALFDLIFFFIFFEPSVPILENSMKSKTKFILISYCSELELCLCFSHLILSKFS